MENLGRYQIKKELGRGAMGTVYRAYDPKIDRVVALKTISISGLNPAEEEDFRKRFVREAQAAGKLSHGSIVTIYDVGEEETSRTPFIVMEFIEGTTLEEFARGERLPLERALELAEQVAEALDYAHERGIVHRDIKPANIIITPDGRAKITDFGIAKLVQTQFTQPGQVLGTPAYMSPEQLSGGSVDGRSDLFSLGVILYWLLTGDKPFPGDTTTAVSFKVVYKDPILPSELNPTLGAEYDYVVLHALAKNAAQRYQRGHELADDLEDLRNGRAPRSRASAPAAVTPERTVVTGGPVVERTVVSSAPTPPPPAGGKTEPLRTSPLAVPVSPVATAAPTRPRWMMPAAALLVLLLLGGVGWWFWSDGQSDDSEGEQEASISSPAPASKPAKKDEPPPWAPAKGARKQQAQSVPAESRMRFIATLHVRGEHNFDRGTLYLYVDDQLVKQVRISGETRDRSGVTVGYGRISESLTVPGGQHTIGIRINAPNDGFDQTRSISGRFDAGQSRTLEISLGKLGKWVGIGDLTRDLTLRWAD
ncbi:MAG: protein kinase [Acidobacteria bacterium]|nr:protein kinase [Acidobacteriota bacterium]